MIELSVKVENDEEWNALIDKAWAAGTVGHRRVQSSSLTQTGCATLVSLIRKILRPESNSIARRVFSSPRNTGIFLLGFCSLVQWRYEAHILQLWKIIHQVKCGDAKYLALQSARTQSSSEAVRRKKVIRIVDATELAVSERCNTETDSFSPFPSDAIQKETLQVQQDSILDFSAFLQDLEGAQELCSLQEQLTERLSVSQRLQLEEDDDVYDAGKVDCPILMEEDDENSFFSPNGPVPKTHSDILGKPLLLTLDLSQTKNAVADSPIIQSSEPSSAETELVTLRHTEAPSARVCRRESFDNDLVILKEKGAESTRKVTRSKRESTAELRRINALMPLIDSSVLNRLITEDVEMVVPSLVLQHPGESFSWRAATEMPGMWKTFIQNLSGDLSERFAIAISNAILRQYMAAKGRRTPESLLSASYFQLSRSNPENTAFLGSVDADSRQSKRSAHFGLSSSEQGSGPTVANIPTPCLSMDDSQSSSLYRAGDKLDTLGDQDNQFCNTMEMTVDKGLHSNRTVSSAEAHYNPNTWQMLCFVKAALRKEAEKQQRPLEEVSVFFHHLVPPHRCHRIGATQAIYQVLLLLTLNDLSCEQDCSYGAIRLKVGKGSISTLVSENTWSSDSGQVITAPGQSIAFVKTPGASGSADIEEFASKRRRPTQKSKALCITENTLPSNAQYC